MRKGVLGVLLIVCLWLLTLSATAMAAELPAGSGSDLAAVISGAGDGDTVRLEADFELAEAITVDKSLTLDLNGHKITGNADETLIISGAATAVSIMDGSANQSGLITSAASSAKVVHLTNNSTLYLESGSIGSTGSSGYSVYAKNASRAHFEMRGGAVSSAYRGVYLGNTASFTMISGSISAKTSGVYCGGMGTTIYVVDGSISGSTAIYSLQMNTKTTVEGGTITGTTQAIYQTKATLTINGGTFNGKINSLKSAATISGGEFSDITNVASCLAAGKTLAAEANANGYYEVVPLSGSNAVAQIGSGANARIYPTLQQAISAAKSGETVTLLQNAELTGAIAITKSITLDLAGHDVTLSGVSGVAGDVFTVYNGAKFTVTGTGTIETTDGDVAIRVGTSLSQTQLTIDSGVTVKGKTAVLIQPPSLSSDPSTYTAFVTVKGTLTGGGSGLNIQGQLIRGTAYIDIENGARITGSTGIYAAGHCEITMNGGAVEGETGIEIRSGQLTVNGGSVSATADHLSISPNGSGGTTVGAGIAVAQHTTLQPITVTVNGGTVCGYVGLNIADPQGNDQSGDIAIEVKGGDFIATGAGEDSVSVKVQNGYDVSGFVSGGNFSDSLMATGYLNGSLQAELESAKKDPDAPFSYYPSMMDALDMAGDGDKVTHVGSMENPQTPIPITFNSGYDGISIIVYVKTGEFTVPDNEYFDYAGHTFSGWKDENGKGYLAGDKLTFSPGERLTLIAQWDKADKTALAEAIKKTEALDENEYTAESWAKLEEALKAAQTVFDDEDATQEEVDAATAALNQAIAALVKAEVPEATVTDPDTVPKTGDNSSIVLWTVLLFLSLAVIVVSRISQKKMFDHTR